MTVTIGVDQGTTGTRVVAFDQGWRVLADDYREVAPSHPRPGWVEKDADAVVASVRDGLRAVAGEVGRDRVAAVGLDNEGETVVAWDADTLEPLAPAIVWSCRRSQEIVERLRGEGAEDRVRELAGTPLDPYFSSTKIRWLIENDPAVAGACEHGRARFGTLDAFVCARLGDGPGTEPSTAARTQLQALAKPGRWDPELCAMFGVDPLTLPPIGPSSGRLGSLDGLPLHALLVDQTAALAGHGCLQAGRAKSTYGTGIFVLANAGATPPTETQGLLPTVAWTTPGDPGSVAYALDGGVFTAGSALGWLRDELGLLGDAAESELLARSVEDSGGVRFLPALTGLAAPWWRPSARAVWAGMTAHTTRAHLVRAVLESLCMRVRDVVEAMSAAGARPSVLRVDGGMTANRWMMQRQADVLGIAVQVADEAEATALGAAAMAGVGAGAVSVGELESLGETGELISPTPESARLRDAEYAAWRRFVEGIAAVEG
ncbi:MAG: FGGY-family carbohydrate kinase [Gaiellales bacterium]